MIIIRWVASSYIWVGDTSLALAMFCFSNKANWLASFWSTKIIVHVDNNERRHKRGAKDTTCWIHLHKNIRLSSESVNSALSRIVANKRIIWWRLVLDLLPFPFLAAFKGILRPQIKMNTKTPFLKFCTTTLVLIKMSSKMQFIIIYFTKL